MKGFCPLKSEIARYPVGFRVSFSQLTASTLVVNCVSGVISLALDKSVIFRTHWTRLKKRYAIIVDSLKICYSRAKLKLYKYVVTPTANF